MLGNTRTKCVYLFFSLLISFFLPKKVISVSSFVKYLQNPILTPNIASWDNKFVANPVILKNGNIYHMWYTGNSGSSWQIGYANSPNGVNGWTFLSNPVLSLGSLDGWENETTDPNVLFFS